MVTGAIDMLAILCAGKSQKRKLKQCWPIHQNTGQGARCRSTSIDQDVHTQRFYLISDYFMRSFNWKLYDLSQFTQGHVVWVIKNVLYFRYANHEHVIMLRNPKQKNFHKAPPRGDPQVSSDKCKLLLCTTRCLLGLQSFVWNRPT